MTVATVGTSSSLPTMDAAQLQSVIAQLQDVVNQLQVLVDQLRASGALGSAQAGAATIGANGAPAPESVSVNGAAQAATGPMFVQDARASARAQSSRSSDNEGVANAKDFALPRKNKRSVNEAMAWARKQVTDPSESWERRCLSFVAHAYGWNGSGVNYAIDHYSAVPRSMRHDEDRNPPPGALVYWTTGSRAGHVALYLGNGMIASNDIKEKGKISVVPMSDIEKKWGANYVGWTPPYFPNGF